MLKCSFIAALESAVSPFCMEVGFTRFVIAAFETLPVANPDPVSQLKSGRNVQRQSYPYCCEMTCNIRPLKPTIREP